MAERKWRIGHDRLRETFTAIYRVAQEMVAHGDLELVLREYRGKRTASQNARYWAIIRYISDTAILDGRQYGVAEWHEYLKRQFLGVLDLPGGGSVAMSSADLTVEAFGEYKTKVEVWAAEQGYGGL